MYGKYLSVLAIVLATIGTFAAILSILKMKLQDVIYARTAIAIDTSEIAMLRQVYDARVGVGLVILSALLQVFCELFGTITCKIFLVVSGVVVLSAAGYWISMYFIYKNSEAELLEHMEEAIRNTYRDSLMVKKCRYMSKYKLLMKEIKGEAAFLSFEYVNTRIDEIISNKSQNDKIKEVKSLICFFEGKTNKSNVYSLFAICFALFIGVVTNKPDSFIILLFLITFILALIAFGVLRRDYKEAFVLKTLNFKLEELCNQSSDDKEIDETSN